LAISLTGVSKDAVITPRSLTSRTNFSFVNSILTRPLLLSINNYIYCGHYTLVFAASTSTSKTIIREISNTLKSHFHLVPSKRTD
jgi:hypothetical protein